MIEASSSVSIGILSRILPEFCKIYPKIHVTVRIGEDTDVLVDRVRQNRIDFAVFLDQRDSYEGCIKAVERYEKFVFVAPPSASPSIPKRRRNRTRTDHTPRSQPTSGSIRLSRIPLRITPPTCSVPRTAARRGTPV